MKTLMNWLSNRTTGRTATRSGKPTLKLRVDSLEDRVVLDAGWAAAMQGALVSRMESDSAGNHYLVGSFSSTATFGNLTLPSNGLRDIFVAKQNAAGQYLWAVNAGNPSSDQDWNTGVALDGAGNVFVTGQFEGTAQFGPLTLTSAGGSDGFVSKLDGATGQFLWARQVGGAGRDKVHAVSVDPTGNAILSSVFNLPGTNQNDAAEMAVIKLDTNGTELWSQSVTGNMTGMLFSLTTDAAGAIYTGGRFKGTANFPTGTLASSAYLPSIGSLPSADSLVAKLDAQGNWLWARSLPGDTASNVRDMTVGPDGRLYVSGVFQGTMNLDATTISSAGGNDFYVTSLQADSGTVNWARRMGADGSGANLAFDPQGNLNIAGSFQGTADFGPFTLTTDGGIENAFVAKLSTSGDFLDVHRVVTGTLSGTSNISVIFGGLDFDSSGNGYIGGWFSGGTVQAPQRPLSGNYGVGYMIKLPPAAATKFFVVDDYYRDRTYQYAANGDLTIDNFSLNTGNITPRGAASNAAGTTVWVGDKNRNVYVYSSTGALQGSWAAGTMATTAVVEGVATNGTDVWVVDNSKDTVYRYAGAASRLSGTQAATSSFRLNSGNSNPKGIVTDGSFIWVVNDSTTDKVFKYSVAGSYLGSWTIDAANQSPTGLTIDPTNGSQDIWIVDNGTDKVYQYANGRSRTSGSQAASATFALAVGNTNPQGIADPPAPGTAISVPNTTIPISSLVMNVKLSLMPFSDTVAGLLPISTETPKIPTETETTKLNRPIFREGSTMKAVFVGSSKSSGATKDNHAIHISEISTDDLYDIDLPIFHAVQI